MARECAHQLPLPEMGVWPDPTYVGGRTRHFRRLGPKQTTALRAELKERQRSRCARCRGWPRRRKFYLHFLTADCVPGRTIGDPVLLCRDCFAHVAEEEEEVCRLFRPCGVR
jgi:hypothetical protein